MFDAASREPRTRRTPSRAATKHDVGSPPAPPKRRRARPPHRKTDHSVIERRRREKINDRLLRLQSVVPACRTQARELFERKGQDASDTRIDSELVLEKLCIISHTVGTSQHSALT